MANILVVDDELGIRDLLSEILNDEGHTVELAENAAPARAARPRACPDLVLASPRDPQARGSQVSFRHPEGYAIMQALIAEGVIGDFRAPDILRFGFTPLYTAMADVEGAARILARVMADRRWDRPEYRRRARVT